MASLPMSHAPIGIALEQSSQNLLAGDEQAALDRQNQLWMHPKANRTVALQLDGQVVRVGYHWIAAKRRTIGMQISAQGLQVRAPRWVGQGDIESTLQSRARWIVQKLAQLQALPQDTSHARVPWSDGAYIAWRGQWLRLALGFAGRRASLQALAEPEPVMPGKHLAGAAVILPQPVDLANPQSADAPQVRAVLHLPLPLHAQEAEIAAMAQHWLRQQAQQQLVERCAFFAPLMGVKPARLSLTSAHTRWGSASSGGAIRLHWRLVQMDPVLFDYVLVHELAHLHEMNHSERFWAWVAQVQPDYAELRQRLKQVRLEAWTL